MSFSWFVTGWGVGFGAYVVLQMLAVATLRNRWRFLSLIPLPFMIYIFIVTVRAEAAGSNLWPLMMILVSPGAALGVVLVWSAGLSRSGRGKYLWVPVLTSAGVFSMALVSSQGLGVLWSGVFTIVPAVVVLLLALTIEIYFSSKDRSSPAA